MKIINLEQGTQDWLNWRAGKAFIDADGAVNPAIIDGGVRITATAASVIAGTNPFTKPYELWAQMLGYSKSEISNYVMQRGHDMEPIARAAYEAMAGEAFAPACIQSDELEYVAASLDGVDLMKTKGLEIKCPISEKEDGSHALAMSGIVAPYYYDQIQWQMLASDNQILEIDYFSYAPQIGEAKPITVKQDHARQKELLSMVNRFRVAVKEKVSLAGSEFDAAAQTFLLLNRQNKIISAQLEHAKEDLKRLANGKNLAGYGVSVSVVEKKAKPDLNAVFSDLVAMHNIPIDEIAELESKHPGKSSITVTLRETADADAIVQMLRVGQTKPMLVAA